MSLRGGVAVRGLFLTYIFGFSHSLNRRHFPSAIFLFHRWKVFLLAHQLRVTRNVFFWPGAPNITKLKIGCGKRNAIAEKSSFAHQRTCGEINFILDVNLSTHNFPFCKFRNFLLDPENKLAQEQFSWLRRWHVNVILEIAKKSYW